MKHIWAALLIAIIAAAARAEEVNLPPHPRLLFNAEGIAHLKDRVAHDPWAPVWKRFIARMDEQLQDKVELPPRGGNWSHNYVCPEHGARLSRGKQIGPWQWEHICPVGPHTLKGDPSKPSLDFDGNAIAHIHAEYSDEIRDMGIAYQVTGDKRYAERAREILLDYADKYLTYPRHTNTGRPVTPHGDASGGSGGGGGRVASQSLTEASWMIQVVQGADLIWDTLSPDQKKTVEDKLFRPALDETIINQSPTVTIHNIQNRRNSAVGLIGLLLGDQQLIHEAIDGISGYRAQMAQGVQEDGVWREGAWGYHFFTIEGIWPLTEAARNCGIDLYGPQLKKMYDAPFHFATPTLTLPPFNDSGEVKLAASAERYELAYARYHDPMYLSLLHRSKRDNEMALWFGVDSLPPADSIPEMHSRNFPVSGYAILQNGQGENATWACMKYGPHGGGHGHYDKLNTVLYARGQMIGVDPGTRAYASPIHTGWDKTSIAHNTLTVDFRSQAAATGKSLAFGSDNGVDYAMADAGEIYDGVKFIRTVLMTDHNALVFVDRVTCDRPRTLDLAWHQRGTWSNLPEGKPWQPPQARGYRFLEDLTTRPADKGVQLLLQSQTEPRSIITLAGGDEPTEVITGTGIGANTADRVPVVIFRRKAKQTTFVWAVSLDGTPLQLTASTTPDGPTELTVSHGPEARSPRKISVDPIAGKVIIGR